MDVRSVRGDGLDLGYFENAEIGLPTVKSIEGVVIRAKVFGQWHPTNRLVEHPAKRDAIDVAGMDGKAYDAASPVIHDDQHPVAAKRRGFTAKHIDAPQAVLHAAEEGQP